MASSSARCLQYVSHRNEPVWNTITVDRAKLCRLVRRLIVPYQIVLFTQLSIPLER